MTKGPPADGVPRRSIHFSTLHKHPAPRYVVAGTITFLVDIGSLKLFHGVAGIALAPATVLAFLVAFIFNFTASRQWTFAGAAREGQTHQQLIRYLILVGINLLTTLIIVVGFSAVGVNYLIAKLVAGCINALGNFFAYRHWIFAAPPVL